MGWDGSTTAPLKVYTGAPTGENAEIFGHMLRIQEATGKKGTSVLDRGFDRRELLGPLVKTPSRSQCGNEGIGRYERRTADGRELSVDAVVGEQECPRPKLGELQYPKIE
jgi:hypothetical protein